MMLLDDDICYERNIVRCVRCLLVGARGGDIYERQLTSHGSKPWSPPNNTQSYPSRGAACSALRLFFFESIGTDICCCGGVPGAQQQQQQEDHSACKTSGHVATACSAATTSVTLEIVSAHGGNTPMLEPSY